MEARHADPDLLTVGEVAERLRLNHHSVRRHIRNGRLKAVRVGGRVRIRREDLEAFMEPVGFQEGPANNGFTRRIGPIPRLTEDLIAELEGLQATILEERGGKPIPPAEVLIDELREERLRGVMGLR